MNLKRKLLITFLCVGLIPTLTITFINSLMAKSVIQEQVFSQLVAVREIKKTQIETYFAERQGDLEILASTTENLLDFRSEQLLTKSAQQYNFYFKQFIETFGYYDLFLIDEKGTIFYSAFKEEDYQSNLLSGPFKDSGLATLFKQVRSSQAFAMSDFRPYEPSNNAPAAFIALPIETPQGQVTIALQLSIKKINSVMQQSEGMGKTGESYLIGNDLLMRSDSLISPQSHSMSASFSGNLKENGVDTESAKLAIRGQTGTKIITDYNGKLALSAYAPLSINGLQWALLSEIQVTEAFAAGDNLVWNILIIVFIILAAIIIVATLIANSILKPLGGEPKEMLVISESIASGDLSVTFEDRNSASVYSAMHKMTDFLVKMMKKIIDDSHQLADAAENTCALSLQSSANLQQQQSSIEMIVAAVEEMSVSINEVAENASQTADSAKIAQQSSEQANSKLILTIGDLEQLDMQLSTASQVITELEKGASEISSVVDVIRNITERTNLLALNAAIEAARAGEKGRGFAVVADEVRALALQTKESTVHIDNVIGLLQSSSKSAVEAMCKSKNICHTTVANAHDTEALHLTMNKEVENISDMTILIASAVEEQSSVSKEITKSISQLHDSAAENIEGVEYVSTMSQKLNNIATSLNELTVQFKT